MSIYGKNRKVPECHLQSKIDSL